MNAYYNENDPYAAEWLRNLIVIGHIASGDVDERSIKDVRPEDLKGYAQCHFFAGIGGWSFALRLAGWPDDRPVWTGSCPCQPFSVAGEQKGQKDERHLWPEWFRLIKESKPAIVFGEQVAGAITHGWLDAVYDDMERENYAIGAAVLPACSVGAPHKRDRLWFVAHVYNARLQGWGCQELSKCASEQLVGSHSAFMANTEIKSEREPTDQTNTISISRQARHELIDSHKFVAEPDSESTQLVTESWGECDFWELEPSVGRVANGIPARSHKLRAYGNAIVPQVAAEFIKAAM